MVAIVHQQTGNSSQQRIGRRTHSRYAFSQAFSKVGERQRYSLSGGERDRNIERIEQSQLALFSAKSPFEGWVAVCNNNAFNNES
jgi:hypothetical protein